MVEFVLLAAPAILLSLTVISVLLSGFSRSLLLDAAVEGARFAALADQTSATGCARSRELLAHTFGPEWSTTVLCSRLDSEGISTERVQASLRIPTLGFLAPGLALNEVSHAQREAE